MEIMQVKKSKGVPRETAEVNNISNLVATLKKISPYFNDDIVISYLNDNNYFDAGMQEQVSIMANACIDLFLDDYSETDIIKALATSPTEKIRGVAAYTIPMLYKNLRDRCGMLKYTGSLEGTWPRELSASILHKLILKHSFKSVMSYCKDWIYDDNEAVRRLIVEALRPRGVMQPHIPELKDDPATLIKLLEKLLDDNSDYVRKAVSNNLNDISKDNPDIILEAASKWNTKISTDARKWVISRALRTLIDEGNPKAFSILDYPRKFKTKITWIDSIPEKIVINQVLNVEFKLNNNSSKNENIFILLKIDEPGKKGRRVSKYQICNENIEAKSEKNIAKRVHFIDKSGQKKLKGIFNLTIYANGTEFENRSVEYI